MNTNTQKTLSYDGCGINGPDEYRTRIATFTNKRSKESDYYGRLFAASPDLLTKLETMVSVFNQEEIDPLQAFIAIEQARAALAAAKGEDV